jgi:hypothetical protein
MILNQMQLHALFVTMLAKPAKDLKEYVKPVTIQFIQPLSTIQKELFLLIADARTDFMISYQIQLTHTYIKPMILVV